jgi:hypothetical protein
VFDLDPSMSGRTVNLTDLLATKVGTTDNVA